MVVYSNLADRKRRPIHCTYGFEVLNLPRYAEARPTFVELRSSVAIVTFILNCVIRESTFKSTPFVSLYIELETSPYTLSCRNFILWLHRLLNKTRIRNGYNHISLDLDSELLQVLVGLNVIRDCLLDHISGLLTILLNPISIELVVALRSALLQ